MQLCLLVWEFLKGTYHVLVSAMIKKLYRAPEIQLHLFVQCFAAILQTTTLTLLCAFGISQPLSYAFEPVMHSSAF